MIFFEIVMVLLNLVQPKYTEIHQQEIPFIGLNVIEFFYLPLYTEFLSDIYKNFK